MILAFVVVALTIFCRPTGWHGESGAAKAGGHITVDFYRRDNNHVTMTHICIIAINIKHIPFLFMN
jgi:hypothetical protein